MLPGAGATIATMLSYSVEKRMSKTPEKFGTGMIEGVVCPEASTHSSIQGDFIPTMSLGIPGDAVMVLLLGALMIQGIVPGPQLISEHPDIFWGLIASFWIGNIILVVLNVPMIGLWVKLLTIPYKYLYPSAMFFVAIGVYSANNDMFQVGEVVLLGLVGYVLLLLDFHPAPILLGFVLGPRFEENFRRAMLISRGDIFVFVKHPISAVFIALLNAWLLAQVVGERDQIALRGGHLLRGVGRRAGGLEDVGHRLGELVAAELLLAAGYDPREFQKLLSSLPEGPGVWPNHPPPKERAAKLL